MYIIGPILGMLMLSLPLAPAFAGTLTGMVKLNDVQSGQLLFKTDQPNAFITAPQLRTDVDITVSGIVARTTVRHHFHNPSTDWLEGLYVFPLPENAAVDGLRMKIGERFIEGQIQEKAAARATYEAAKQAGQKASLLEQHRANIFKSAVANIGPDESITIELRYQQALAPERGRFSLRFPMVVGPRYRSPGAALQTVAEPSLPPKALPPKVLPPGQAPENPVALSVTLNTGLPAIAIDSPYHAITQDNATKPGIVEVRLAAQTVPAERDFVLHWRLAQTEEVTTAILRERRADGDYYLVMALPPKSAAENGIDTQGPRYRRDLVFILDQSGSMAGASFDQAKAGLIYGLSRLQPGDSFNVFAFNDVTTGLFRASQPVNANTLRQALAWIGALNADGGTEMQPALSAALGSSGPDTALRQVLFLTDGNIYDEGRMFRTIHRQLHQARMFPIGLGSAPNSVLLKGAGRIGRGKTTMIGDLSEVEKEMKALFEAIERPVLTSINTGYRDAQGQLIAADAWEQSPNPIPDLFAGAPLFFVVKAPPQAAELDITAHYGATPWRRTLALQSAKNGTGIAKLWARQTIGELEFARQLQPDNPAFDQTILAHALTYGLVSRLTSLVAVDVTPSRPATVPLNSSDVPTRLPHGWDWQKFNSAPVSPVQKASLQNWSNRTAGAPLRRQTAQTSAAVPSVTDATQAIRLPGTATPAPFARAAGFTLLFIALVTFMAWRYRPRRV